MNANRKRILVADDNVGIIETLVDILHGSDYEVILVNNGEEAVEQARNGCFDLALMDIQMPVLDGLEAFQQIQQLKPELPVLLMTAWAHDDLVDAAQKAGVAGVFTKPFDIRLLLSEIGRITLSDNEPPSVLVIDDDPDICQLLKRRLDRCGWHVDVTLCARDALEHARLREYDVVFMDICLPDASGLEVYTQLKQLQPHTIGVMMTGYGNEPQVRSLLREASQNGYLCLEKPFSIEQVLAVVQQERAESNGESKL